MHAGAVVHARGEGRAGAGAVVVDPVAELGDAGVDRAVAVVAIVAGAAAEGTYVSFFSPDPNLVPEAQPYNEIYTAATGNEFGAFGGASAFTTYIGLQAIKVCADGGDLSRACVVDALTNINLESSPLGLPVAFGEGNQIAGSRFFLFQVKDGKFTLVQ